MLLAELFVYLQPLAGLEDQVMKTMIYVFALVSAFIGLAAFEARHRDTAGPQKYAVVTMTLTGSPEVKLGPTWVVGPDGARIIPDAHREALTSLKDGAEWSAPTGISQWDRPCVPSWDDKYWDQYLDHQEQRWAYKGRPTAGLKLTSVRVYDPR